MWNGKRNKTWGGGKAARWAAAAGVLVAVAWVYWGVLGADFVGWDDGAYITGNYRVQQWGWEYFKDYFRMRPKWGPMPNAQYTPLVEVTYAVEHRLAGSTRGCTTRRTWRCIWRRRRSWGGWRGCCGG